nr:uncharacterized protein CXorf58 homolog isoform X1 [Anolis sagrei ordinatus]
MFSNVRIVLPDEEDEEDEGNRRRRIAEEQAVNLIQKFWWTHIRKRLFKLLKHTIRAAEHCISHEILKRVSPLEAELLKEPTIQYKVRFRFAGTVFPPFIVFKIFFTPGNQGNQYMSGKTVITSTTKAAVDACKLMGYRKYYNQMLWDELQYKKYGIMDEIDIATIRDYVQSLHLGSVFNFSILDLMALVRMACSWAARIRPSISFFRVPFVSHIHVFSLSIWLSIFPRNCPWSAFFRQFSLLLWIVFLRSPVPCPTTACLSKRDRMSLRRISERRSYQARQKVSKMRKVYRTKKGEEEELDHPSSSYHLRSLHSPTDNESLFSDEDWEQEAVRLYDWARSLRSEDIGED